MLHHRVAVTGLPNLSRFALIESNISSHIELTSGEFEYFTSLLQLRPLRKREFLLRAGDVCHFEAFVNKGCLRIYHVDSNGFEYVLDFAMEGWWVADIVSFAMQLPAELSIDALEKSEVFLIDKESKEKLYGRVPKFERLFRMITQQAHVALQRRLIASMGQTAKERYLELVKRCPRLVERVPQHQIASYLGISPEFLSKVRKGLARKRPTSLPDETGIPHTDFLHR